MADNVAVTEGSGKDIATDDVGGKQYQRIKLDLGTDGVTAPALAGAGVVATGVQRVTLASDDPAVVDLAAIEVLLGTIDTDTGNIVTAIQLLDNAVDGNYLNTNLNIAGTDCVGNAGVNAAGVLRVTIATDDECNNFLGTIDADTGNMVTALQLLDNAVDGNYLNVNLNVAGTDAAAGEGVISAQTQRVTIATDDDGVAHLATLAGAVAATHMQCDIVAGTVTTVSTVTNLAQMGGTAIAMNEGVLAAGVQRVTLATDDDGVAHLATIAGDTTNIETAIQIIDDWDATHASAAVADGPQIMGAAYSTALPTDVGADADAARLVTDRYGRLCTGLQPQAAKAIVDNADTTTAREIVAATATRRIFITSLIISVDTAGNYWLEDGDATQVTGKMYFAANGGCAQTFPEGTPLNTVTQNKALNVKGSTAGNVSVTVTYYLAV